MGTGSGTSTWQALGGYGLVFVRARSGNWGETKPSDRGVVGRAPPAPYYTPKNTIHTHGHPAQRNLTNRRWPSTMILRRAALHGGSRIRCTPSSTTCELHRVFSVFCRHCVVRAASSRTSRRAPRHSFPWVCLSARTPTGALIPKRKANLRLPTLKLPLPGGWTFQHLQLRDQSATGSCAVCIPATTTANG